MLKVKNRHSQTAFDFPGAGIPFAERVRRLSYKIQAAIEGKDVRWDNIPIREAYAQGAIPESLFAPAFDLAMKRIEQKMKKANWKAGF